MRALTRGGDRDDTRAAGRIKNVVPRADPRVLYQAGGRLRRDRLKRREMCPSSSLGYFKTVKDIHGERVYPD